MIIYMVALTMVFIRQVLLLDFISVKCAAARWKIDLAGEVIELNLLTTWFSTVIFRQRTFTSLVHVHAERTQDKLTRTV